MEKHLQEGYHLDLLDTAARLFGFEPAQATALDGFENYVFEYRRDGRSYILRLSHSSKKPLQLVEAELDFVNHLAESGVAVARAVPSLAGSLTEILPAGGPAEYYTAVSFVKAPGHHPTDSEHSPALHRAWGRLLGRLHRASRCYTPSRPGLSRPEWDEEIEVTQPELFLPPDHELFLERYYRVIEELYTLPVDPASYGLIHNDAHPGNFLVHRGEITLIDFEDVVRSWYASELAICLFFACVWPPHGQEPEAYARFFWPLFLDGYLVESPLEREWLACIPLFLKFREFGQYVTLHRAADLAAPDPWVARFLAGRRARLEQDVPYLDIDFTALV